MNHRPFEDWLLAEESLSAEQKVDLQDHLKTCTSCLALAEVNMALRSKKTTIPAPGFNMRFQSRLAARRSAQRRRNFWGIFVLAVAAVGMLIWRMAGLVQLSCAWHRTLFQSTYGWRCLP
jgi:hypothetical protein